MIQLLQNFTKRSETLSSDFLCSIAKNVLAPSDNGSNNEEYLENFGESQPDMTVKTLSSANASNNKVAMKPSLKMAFTMVLKSLVKYLITYPAKDFPQRIGLMILLPHLMNLKSKRLRSFKNSIHGAKPNESLI